MSSPLAPAGNYFHRLDAIRGLAILWVLAYHTSGACFGWDVSRWQQIAQGWPPWLAIPGQVGVRLLGTGALGVPIFFVLSGFLIHFTYSRGSDQRISTFWWRRWWRICPPYLVALLAFAVWGGYLWHAAGRRDVLYHLLLVHNLNDRTFFSINGSFWSLAHEAQFYALYPLVLGVRRLIGMRALLGLAFTVRIAMCAYFLWEPDRFARDPATMYMLPRMYFEWILGMYVADCCLHNRPGVVLPSWAGWLCAAYAVFAAGRGWWDLLAIPAISVATAIWIEQIVHQRRAASRTERLLMPLGVISYSLYLWHQPIVNELVSHVVQSPRGLAAVGSGGLFVAAFALSAQASILVAMGSYQLIELPCIQYVKQRMAARPASTPATAAPNDQRDLRVDEGHAARPPVAVPATHSRQQR